MSKRRRGEGTIYKRGERYQAQYVAKGPDGRRRRYSVSGATVREVVAKLAERKAAVAQGTHARASKRLTTSDYLTRWLDDQEARLRPGTLRAHAVLVRFVVDAIGDVPLALLDGSDHIAPLYRALRVERSPRGRPLAPATLRRLHAVLHRALEDAIEARLIEVNPSDRARRSLPPMKDARDARARKMQTLSPDQLEVLYATAAEADPEQRDGQGRFVALASRDYSPLWRLLATTGLRIGEALSLTWDCVDLDKGTVRVMGTGAAVVDGELFIPPPKTAKSRRTVRLTPPGMAALKAHAARQAKERLRQGASWLDFDLVFCGPSGGPQDRSAVYHKFHRDLERAGLPKIRLHDTRHSAATILLEEGVHPKVVQEMLGHSSVALTLDTYSHLTPQMQETATAAMAAAEERAKAKRESEVQQKCSSQVVSLGRKP